VASVKVCDFCGKRAEYKLRLVLRKADGNNYKVKTVGDICESCFNRVFEELSKLKQRW
jgi:hypothetical protein